MLVKKDLWLMVLTTGTTIKSPVSKEENGGCGSDPPCYKVLGLKHTKEKKDVYARSSKAAS